jgi:molybdopterin molybdotransferase
MTSASSSVSDRRTEGAAPDVETVGEHLGQILEDTEPLAPIELPAQDALGLVLAEDVIADDPLPPFSAALRGGYAVVAEDSAGASPENPAVLEVGASGQPGGPGLAVPVSPAMPLPDGADALVPEDAVHRGDDGVEVVEPIAVGANVRHRGQDLEPGQRALEAGRRLRPGDVAVLAALGQLQLRCHPRPRVVVLATGSELVRPDTKVEPGLVRDSNGPMLQALLRQAGAVTFSAGTVGEDRRALMEALDSNLGHADAFVVAGGSSGIVRDVLEMLGDVRPATVAMEPGQAQLYGRVRGVPVFGIPGHPAASFVSFEIFIRPALRRMQGRGDLLRPRITASLGDSVRSTPGVATYLRVRLDRGAEGWTASLAGSQDPHDLRTLAAADGLAEIPRDVEQVGAGEALSVHLLVEP